jgi:hypothetical protein
MAWYAVTSLVVVALCWIGHMKMDAVCCRKPESSELREFLSQIKLSSPGLLNAYMETAIRLTEPEDVRNSPDAQRIRAAMIASASYLLPLYDCVGGGPAERDERAALMSSIQFLFYRMYGVVKCMVLQSTTSHLSGTSASILSASQAQVSAQQAPHLNAISD